MREYSQPLAGTGELRDSQFFVQVLLLVPLVVGVVGEVVRGHGLLDHRVEHDPVGIHARAVCRQLEHRDVGDLGVEVQLGQELPDRIVERQGPRDTSTDNSDVVNTFENEPIS